MQVKIGEIRPNPFRNTVRYPIIRTKVDGLRSSYKKTGFWDNIIGRVIDGIPERAFGEHRYTALMEEYGPDHVIDLIIRDWSDEKMLKSMADENLSVWGHNANVEHETIRAVVEAYAAGKIELEVPSKDTRHDQLRYAPSFKTDVSVVQHSRSYTANTVARFLGWTSPKGEAQDRVVYSLMALELIEEDLLSETEFDLLSTSQARAVVVEARRARQYRLDRAKEEQKAQEYQAKLAEEARIKAEQAATELEKAEAEREQIQAARRHDESEKKEEQWKDAATKAAKEVGVRLSNKFKAKDLSISKAREEAEKIAPKSKKPTPPDINTAARKMSSTVFRLLTSDMNKQLRELVEFRENIRPIYCKNLAARLRQVSETLLNYADQLTEEQEVENDEVTDIIPTNLQITHKDV